ncbi:MAG: hypothetical protein ACYTJ0_03470 [Planctomycetota bacterium]|jgi:hypothetical protein
MYSSRVYDRVAWVDRFATPTIKTLRKPLPAEARPLFDRIHKALSGLEGIRESFAWYGEGWNWTIEFRTKRSSEPLAVLIPSPTDLQLAIPLDPDFTRSLPLKRMKRAIRDGLELAQEPFDTRWGVWSLQAPGMVADLEDLVTRKLDHQAASTRRAS